jgi:hypothetical protein
MEEKKLMKKIDNTRKRAMEIMDLKKKNDEHLKEVISIVLIYSN